MMISLLFFILIAYILQIKHTEVCYGSTPYSYQIAVENPGFIMTDAGSLFTITLCHGHKATLLHLCCRCLHFNSLKR